MVAESALQLEPPPRPWRLSSRLLLVDEERRLLLIRAFDPANTRAGQWWEIPGGGVEPGEDTAAAAVRETAEETGYLVPPHSVGPACWTGETTYLWAHQRYWASLVMHLAQVRHPLPRRRPNRLPAEEASCLGVCWVPSAEVMAGSTRCFPAALPADLPQLLAGERVDAGFSIWS